MEASRKTYEPTAKEISKAQKIAAQPSPAKWTPGKAQARRWAGMILDSARGVPDAWLYFNTLSGEWKGVGAQLPDEPLFAAIDRVNAAIDRAVLDRLTDEEISEAVGALQEAA